MKAIEHHFGTHVGSLRSDILFRRLSCTGRIHGCLLRLFFRNCNICLSRLRSVFFRSFCRDFLRCIRRLLRCSGSAGTQRSSDYNTHK